jgi:hypothetical protein
MTSDQHHLVLSRPSHWEWWLLRLCHFPLRRRLPCTTEPAIMLSIVMLSAWMCVTYCLPRRAPEGVLLANGEISKGSPRLGDEA